MKQVDLLIFDLDGTLVDTRVDLANSINHTRKAFGLPVLDADKVVQHVGDGVRKLMQRSMPDASDAILNKALGIFQAHYRTHLLDNSRFYPGVDDVLHHFSNKTNAVVSNKPEEFTRAILKGLNASNRFAHVVGGDSLPVLKPDPLPILHILEAARAIPAKTVMIGDSISDIDAGRRAGVWTCAVTYGFRSRALLETAKPDYILDRIDGLLSLFE